MDLIEIVKVFHLVPDKNLYLATGLDDEPDDPERAGVDRWGLPRDMDERLSTVFADAAHIYWIAREAARGVQGEDPWAHDSFWRLEQAALRGLYGAWDEARRLGRALDERSAMRKLRFRTPAGLKKALHRFGYSHSLGHTISAGVVRVFTLMRADENKRKAAEKKRRQRQQAKVSRQTEAACAHLQAAPESAVAPPNSNLPTEIERLNSLTVSILRHLQPASAPTE